MSRTLGTARSRRAAPLVVAVALTALLAACQPAPPAGQLPTDHTLVGVVAAGAKDPRGAPPGANDFSCKPSKAHPRPVVLVHGLLATMTTNFNSLSPVIKNAGYCVYALTYGAGLGDPYVGGLGAMEQSAQQLKAFVAKVRASTKAAKVDIVGHSEGTVMPQYYLKFLGGAAEVKNFVALTPLYDGTTLAGVSSAVAIGQALAPPVAALGTSLVGVGCASCPQFLQGSPFLKKLNQGGAGAASVRYTNVMTRYDELVLPYTSGEMGSSNATNIVLQDDCPLDLSEHLTVAFNPRVDRIVLNALDPSTAKPVPCVPVVPVLGG
ncbi:alpha/beta hydrolase [Aquihabitans sp. G128]|uniref:lipase family alpha/beta hydrolase n=1 Tax=Aquihabitans sp. G128 TaxID=2849779 RepID=UPI001C247B12|nr:alpha/beta hydrolase [Aquihabitans sp. G128]QXC63079.1 alpha/beta hydrolase [Aquihabitans sp. G128]